MERVPTRKEEVIWRNLEGDAVLLDPHNGKYYGLNGTGCSFWEHIDGSKTLSEIVDLMMEEYDVDRELLARDVEELAAEMHREGLIHFK